MRYLSSIDHLSALAMAFATAAQPAAAQCYLEQQQVLALDGTSSDEFGSAVAVSGSVALVGAWRDSAAASLSGSAYVFRLAPAGWMQEQKLVPADAAAFDFFGWSVAIDGDTAVVGAISDQDAAPDGGSVYVFRYNGATWQPEAELFASDANDGDHFGVSVALQGDTLLVGADLNDQNGTWSGAAYVFRKENGVWTERQKLEPSTPSSYEHFGASVDLDGDLLVVGAYGGPSQLFRGTAYVFRFNGQAWQEDAALVGSLSASGDFFASAVAISNGRVLCGARWADVGTINGTVLDTGEAYVFAHDGQSWYEEQRITEQDPQPGDGLGYAVDLAPDLALIGVHNRDEFGVRSGEAVILRRFGSAWLHEPRVIPSDTREGDMFGLGVALQGRYALIGAPHDDDRAPDAGAAYFFDLLECLPSLPGDLDGDGDVDQGDLGILLANYGQSCD